MTMKYQLKAVAIVGAKPNRAYFRVSAVASKQGMFLTDNERMGLEPLPDLKGVVRKIVDVFVELGIARGGNIFDCVPKEGEHGSAGYLLVASAEKPIRSRKALDEFCQKVLAALVERLGETELGTLITETYVA